MRVVVADDVLLTRAGIVRLLGDAGVEVAGEASDATELLQLVATERPDVAVVDIRMPPTHTDEGLVAAQQIRRGHPEVSVLILSQYVEPVYAWRLFEEYPEHTGYLLKDRVFDIAVVVDALRRVVAGETVIDASVVARLMGGQRRRGAIAALTDRERDVLALVAEGYSNRAIADRIHVSERTVETHVGRIFQKLQLPEGPDRHRRVMAVVAYFRSDE